MAYWDQNNDIIQGNNLLLYLTSAHTVVAYSTSVSLQVDNEPNETTSKFSCAWSDAIGGKNSYSINADSLYTQNSGGTSFDNFIAMMVAGDQVEWYIGSESGWTGDGNTCINNPHALDTTKDYYNGRAIITSCSLEAGMDEAASCSITMQGCGEIQKNQNQITGS